MIATYNKILNKLKYINIYVQKIYSIQVHRDMNKVSFNVILMIDGKLMIGKKFIWRSIRRRISIKKGFYYASFTKYNSKNAKITFYCFKIKDY